MKNRIIATLSLLGMALVLLCGLASASAIVHGDPATIHTIHRVALPVLFVAAGCSIIPLFLSGRFFGLLGFAATLLILATFCGSCDLGLGTVAGQTILHYGWPYEFLAVLVQQSTAQCSGHLVGASFSWFNFISVLTLALVVSVLPPLVRKSLRPRNGGPTGQMENANTTSEGIRQPADGSPKPSM